LVIPAYNEGARLPATLAAVITFLNNWGLDYRVIVVNDGSQDRTAAATDSHDHRCSTMTQSNLGKGAAVRNGFLNATGRVVAFTDADLPFDLASLRAAFDIIDSHHSDAVFGSRTLTSSKSKVKRHLSRVIASNLFRVIVQAVASPTIRDTQCGLKIFSRLAAQAIFSRATINGFAFDIEVVFLAHRLQLRVHELPVVLVNERGSTISLTRSAIPMLLDLVRIRWKMFMGTYNLRSGLGRVPLEGTPPVQMISPSSGPVAHAAEVGHE
jgi:dolichyl-phosphate beta-glucosyltransferase